VSADRRDGFDAETARLQGLLAALEELDDPAAKSAARQMVQAVIELHGLGLSDLLAIVQEAGTQSAGTLLPKFAANPKVRGLLLLHDLHPEDLETRARKAVEHLHPHLGVRGVRADFVEVQDKVVRISVTASGQKSQRPSADELRREIEDAVMEMAPDAADLIIEGLEATGSASEVYVPLSSITRRRKVGEPIGVAGDLTQARP